jgi:hypothetical protein
MNATCFQRFDSKWKLWNSTGVGLHTGSFTIVEYKDDLCKYEDSGIHTGNYTTGK